MRRPHRALGAAAILAGAALPPLAAQAQEEVPTPAVIGPIGGAQGQANRRQFFATDIALAPRGYVEQEFFLEGAADAYDTPTAKDMLSVEVTDRPAAVKREDVPYRTRMIVRRPTDPAAFNGTVVVEWLNVTDGFDGEYFWVQAHKHLLRDGYAYVGISAQDNAISKPQTGLKAFSSARYGALDVAGGGDACCAEGELSFDIFAQAAQAALSDPDVLPGLSPDNVIGVGMSQSGIRLGVYANQVHAQKPIFDALLVQVWNPPIRDDFEIPVIKVVSETEAVYMKGVDKDQPDTDLRHTWWVAGASHGDVIQRIGRTGVRYRDLGVALTGNDSCGPTDATGASMTRSRVPLGHVVNAALDALKAQIETGAVPPSAPRLEPAAEGAEGWFARDAHGLAKGGIRLAAVEAPIARAEGVECGAVGVWEPFTPETLQDLYPSHQDYVAKVREAARASVEAGFVLPADAQETLAAAEASVVGTGLTCGTLCEDRAHYRLDFSSTGMLRGTAAFYDIQGGATLMAAIEAAHRHMAQGDSAEGTVASQEHALAAHELRRFLDLLARAQDEGRVTPTASRILAMQAQAILDDLRG